MKAFSKDTTEQLVVDMDFVIVIQPIIICGLLTHC